MRNRSYGAVRSQSGRAYLWVGMAILVLQGCAIIPGLKPNGEMKSVSSFKSANSFTAPNAEWPKEEWWRSYGDPQLDLLIEDAFKDSPSLAIAQARLRQATGVLQMVDSLRLPQVFLYAEANEQQMSYNWLFPKVAAPQGWNDFGLATLNFKWDMDFWGKNHSALNAAALGYEAMQAELAQSRLILSSSLTLAYAQLANFYKSHETAKAALDVRTKTAEVFRSRYQQGLETLGSVRLAETRLAGAEAEVAALEERIALQKNAIAALLGAGPDRGLSIERPKIDLAAARGLPQELALELLGRRPDIVAARLRAEAAAKRIDYRKAEFYPNIDMVASIGVQSIGLDRLTKPGSMMGSIGPTISLPIFNTKGLEGQLEGAYAEYDMAVASYNATLVNALREVADAATSRGLLAKQLKAYGDAYQSASEAYQIANRRYRGGLSNYLEVLSAEDSMLGTQRALTEMQTRALALDVAMIRALGGGYQDPSKPARAGK